MKKFKANKSFKIILLSCVALHMTYIVCNAQEIALVNYGDLQIHENGAIGFHTNLVNNGNLKNNQGRAGFYNSVEPLTISGNQTPTFLDLEIDVLDNLYLETTTEVIKELIFFNGNIVTPRQTPQIYLRLFDQSICVLEDNAKHVDGYTGYIGLNSVAFPTGHKNNLRQLEVMLNAMSSEFITAYYNEDPNFPSVLKKQYETSKLATSPENSSINQVTTVEFWDIIGTGEITINLTWAPQSFITNIAKDIQEIKVAGWNIEKNQWENLGSAKIEGDLNSGRVTSNPFIAENYDVVSFGAIPIGSDTIEVFNFMSPNGDGINDTFVIQGIENKPNHLTIFNRWGNIVYETNNYKNNWDGTSHGRLTVSSSNRLPTGTYFYMLKLPDSDIKKSGYIYLTY